MSLSLKFAAERLGLGHRKLMAQMRTKGLLGSDNLPAHPDRDKAFLVTRESQWFHPECGMQYQRATRVTPAGLPWLAQQLGIDRPLPEPQPDPRDVA